VERRSCESDYRDQVLKYGIVLVLGGGFSLALTPLARSSAFRLGAVDKPGDRRVHKTATARFGGTAILPALVLSIISAALFDRLVGNALAGELCKLISLGIAAITVTAVGALDDVHPLRPVTKLMVEIAAASILVNGGYRIESLFGMHLELLSLPLSVLFIVTVINAVNMIDGLDGLAAGMCLIITITLFLLCLSSGQTEPAILLAALCGVLLGFLPYNLHPARIFLGDSGALLLGLLLGSSAISTSHKMAGAVAIAAPLLAVGLPLVELMLTTLRRLLRAVHVVRLDKEVERYEFLFMGRPALFSADRDHIHHRLLSLGIRYKTVVFLLYTVSVATCAMALLITIRQDLHQGSIFFAFICAAVVGVRSLGYVELRPFRSGLLLPLFASDRINRKIVHVLIDFGFVVGSYLAAFLIQNEGNRMGDVLVVSFPVIVVAQMACFAIGGLYRRSYRRAGIDDVVGLLKNLAFAIGVGWIAITLLPSHVRIGVIVLDAYILATMILGSRISFRLLDHLFEPQRLDALHAPFFGNGNRRQLALRHLRTNAGLGMTVAGFLDDDSRRLEENNRGT
jgi:UDP-GlcNAc:undecaprenyl-phosphate GlcNAc-1-phosphate transferase